VTGSTTEVLSSDDPELKVDLTGPEYGFSSRNQIQKEDIKRRGIASPDLDDCLAIALSYV
jgi:hypothetical protein